MTSAAQPCGIVFVPLAMNQTRFYLGVARALADRGQRCGFLCFHDGSIDAARQAGFAAVSGFGEAADADADPIALTLVAREYGVEHPGLALSHELMAYELTDPRALLGKFVRYLRAAERALRAFGAGGADGPVIVQELGGFLSVQAVFYAARRLGLDNVFIEPSFFRGRVFFTFNTFRAPQVTVKGSPPSATVRSYLADAREHARIVIPAKDRAHYRNPVQKVLSVRNVRRLVEKALEKHLLKRREEFDHIGGHVRRHLTMVKNATRLRPYYVGLPDQPFVYYPLHVPADVALTLRTPELLDQLALVEYLARAVPPTHLVALKEHPALRGGIAWRRLADLTRRFRNVRLLDPHLNNYGVLQRAAAVVTINSKSGAEAIMLGRPVVVLGDAFYRESGLVEATTPSELPRVLEGVLGVAQPRPEAVASYFQDVWNATHAGELYDASPENCVVFAASLAQVLVKAPAG